MRDCLKFYIDGRWVEPSGTGSFELLDPATELPSGRVALGDAVDVDRAVAAARTAFDSYSRTSREARIALLQRIAEVFEARKPDMIAAVIRELGCPAWLAEQAQVPLPATHIAVAIDVLKDYRFDTERGSTLIRRQPIGVCALITPWNWPVSLVMTKVIPALAVGCTVVLKPSEYAPYSAQVLAEILDEAEVPAGVFNMLFGEGAVVGAALSGHPDVDAVSITGSTRAGIEVARNAASTVKRVHQELGGKSPNVILDGADLQKAVSSGVRYMFINAGQTCSVPSRMIVPRSRLAEVVEIARSTAETLQVGPPDSGAFVGPVINASQWSRVQGLIEKGIEEGATLVVGGPGKPEGLAQGYYVRPTIFSDVGNDMTIAREEIFGPVLAIIPFDNEDDAVRIANDTPYGLAAYVHAGTIEQAREVGARIRAGQVNLNGDLDLLDPYSPFGGCKMSGNGREWGAFGFEAFLEEVSYVGYTPGPTSG
ncbi:aldehyde dehydrogenase family protein [Luteimonas sp. BDR2-5]|uniref:aldehyde dehydrogenase family protein n=1 Tax=Proluteimonas luteida TaxID=2878685 RepID=UPI001E4E291A|nr:aldehyde dehydrogenase family protein [Luteimonas sp. BDR2-5]MCD9029722.1 aldehyde dehydrogenase family protein [Luteimonas sp. BDR2-5]